jgi:hypothetical protein
MEREVRPEPSSEELEAIDEALARLVAEPVEPRSKWWREGIRENILEESDD